MRYLLLSVLCALVVSAQSAAPAQEPKAAQNPVPAPSPPPGGQSIRVQVNEVIVPVTVTDEKGRFVSDLDKKDFKIFDEGREQNIEFFTRERSQPVVVGFLVDQSNASRMHWSK